MVLLVYIESCIRPDNTDIFTVGKPNAVREICDETRILREISCIIDCRLALSASDATLLNRADICCISAIKGCYRFNR